MRGGDVGNIIKGSRVGNPIGVAVGRDAAFSDEKIFKSNCRMI